MGSVPGSLFGHQPKTTVQPICIDQNSGQIGKLGEDQPIAIRRRLNSALESVGGKIRSAAFRRRTLSSNNRRGSTSFQQKIQQTEQLNTLKMRFSEGESEKQNKIGEVNNNNEHTRTSLENKNLIKIKKTSREEENINIFNKLIENQSEDKLNFDSSICSEQTTTTTIFGRHKEEEFNNISSYNLNSKEEKNNCGDDINDDVEILIDIKNEENEISNSALTDTFYIEKRELNLVRLFFGKNLNLEIKKLKNLFWDPSNSLIFSPHLRIFILFYL
uniref:Uncharacterized protein n=1 Tax=Meloidogyne enterolobii TaxID=390850 RepID=A0A6V7VT83_MELEN|nr:unnamed protein product [Meloidogyne enterolobii]